MELSFLLPKNTMHYLDYYQWRIQDFLRRRRAPTSEEGAKPLNGKIVAENYMKMRETGLR